jgi:hypothetical protein
MNELAAERYAQNLSIRYAWGHRNHERHRRNAVAFAFYVSVGSVEAILELSTSAFT